MVINWWTQDCSNWSQGIRTWGVALGKETILSPFHFLQLILPKQNRVFDHKHRKTDSDDKNHRNTNATVYKLCIGLLFFSSIRSNVSVWKQWSVTHPEITERSTSRQRDEDNWWCVVTPAMSTQEKSRKHVQLSQKSLFMYRCSWHEQSKPPHAHRGH